jgi:asparagine synthase (glutamine-hydrolysing)
MIREHDPARRYIQSEVLFRPDELKRLLGHEVTEASFPEDAVPRLTGHEHPLNAAIALESRARLPDYVILRLDKLSMRHSLETRTPFLDYRLAEMAATLPVQFKVNLDEGREKFICSYAYEKFSILDPDTALRKKLPFTIPLADWLSDPSSLPDFLQDIMMGDVIQQQGLFDPTVVQDYVKNISSVGIGPQTLVSEADRVFAVVVFTLWYMMFMGR